MIPLRGWFAAALLLVAAGCGGTPSPNPIAGNVGTSQSAPPAPSATAKPSSPPTQAASLPAKPRPAPKPKPRPVVPPSELLKATAAQARSRLGPPDFVRHDPPAELWQYRGESCVLDLFLYKEGKTAVVRHVETRPRDGIVLTPAGCYGTLLSRASSP
ncbi:hypothetical protein [Magnetospira sp. QH-2]|uniref:hypothetical protein n=1 Tax=Magnetospira sp. (strain QH-2) TaxID=1288970 RepID=UPI0003E80C1C|nr:hypothetical protein [Magnetospira sp. QH-2]CCQ72228.1 conserved exported protein of unknown function [Magnetospira sp. QH-2]